MQTHRFRLHLCCVIAALACIATDTLAQTAKRAGKSAAKAPEPAAPESAPLTPGAEPKFAPDQGPLAALWNGVEFQKRFLGSYGFHPDVEPKLQSTNDLAFYRSLNAVLRDNPEQAITMLVTNITAESNPVFDYTLGTIYFQQGDLTNAVKHYHAATAKFPDFRRAHKNLGFALVRLGNYEDAVPALTRTVELGGADGYTYGLLGYSHLNLSRYLPAEAAYKNAMMFMPENHDWKLGLVKCLIGQSRHREAAELLDEMLAKNPDNDTLWALQASVFMELEQPQKAAVNYEVLRKLGKANQPMLMLLGDIYMTREAKELALAVYLEAIEKDAGQNPSRSLRAADILVSRGAWDEAGALFKKIRASVPGGLAGADELRLLRLESKVAMASGAGEQAIKVLEEIIARNPLDGEALMLAGDYYAQGGDVARAEFRYETAAKISGFEADALVKQAQLLVKSGKYAPAAEVLKRAQKVKPRDNVQRYLERVEQLARGGRS